MLPVTSEEFDALLSPLGPFEPAPTLAVACSGGVDSVTLLALAVDWARARGGAVLALSFDHGLRPESAAEVTRVGQLAQRLGADFQALRWTDPAPTSALHERARAARYAALLGACAGAGILHLLLAHHGDDQAETVWQRLSRGSGPDGLAAMAPLTVRREARLLRPLLPLPKARLRATALARGLPWDEDPSNLSTKYERGRQRLAGSTLADLGVTPGALTALAERAGADRAWADRRLSLRLAEMVVTLGEGWLRLDLSALERGDPWETARALARAAGSLSGAERSGDPRALATLLEDLPPPGKSRSLAGCLWRREGRGGGLLVVREVRGAAAKPQALTPGQPLLWDGRYRIVVLRPGLVVAPLGEAGWAALSRSWPGDPPPPLAGIALPALWDAGKAMNSNGILAVPSPGVWRYPARGGKPDPRKAGAAVNRVESKDFGPWDDREWLSIHYRPRLPMVPLGTRLSGHRL